VSESPGGHLNLPAAGLDSPVAARYPSGMNEPAPKCLSEIAAGTKYPIDAFHFVRRGLDYTVHRIHVNPESLSEEQRHVTGRQLSEGLREFALEQYGFLARTVLRRLRIHRTEDFGRIVFAMVEGGHMQATESDTPRDFDSVFEFDAAFTVDIALDAVPAEGIEGDEVQHV